MNLQDSNLVLTDKQKEVIFKIAFADRRSPAQVLANLLSTGISIEYGCASECGAMRGQSPDADDLAQEIENESLFQLGFLPEEKK